MPGHGGADASDYPPRAVPTRPVVPDTIRQGDSFESVTSDRYRMPGLVRIGGSVHANAGEIEPAEARRVLASVESAAAVVPLFQPIVDIESGRVVGYEALSRWPAEPGVDPTSVFVAARRLGRIVEVDAACRRAVMEAAKRLQPDTILFVNLEPDTLGAALAAGEDVFGLDADGLRVVLELTERALLDNPAELISVVEAARARGLGIALDDVGAAPESMALLSLVAPDVVKLDASLLADVPTDDQMRVVVGVTAYAQSLGATVLAEGVETDAQRVRARSLGATLAQGWSYGRPAPLPRRARRSLPRWVPHRARPSIPLLSYSFDVPAFPSDALGTERSLVSTKEGLLRLCLFLEKQAAEVPEPLTVLAGFGDIRRFTSGTADRYAALAQRNPFVAVLGVGMEACPAPGVRGTSIAVGEPFVDEWTLVLVGQQYYVALVARDLGDGGPEAERRFRFAITFDRCTVVNVGRSVMRRIAAT